MKAPSSLPPPDLPDSHLPDSHLPAPALAEHLTGDLGWSLAVLFRAYVKSSSYVVADVPGGHRGYQVLAAAAHTRVGSQSVLAEQLGIDRTVLTYLIDDLERFGLVERRPNPADRRNRQIWPTERGSEVLELLECQLAAIDAHVLSALSEADRETFKTLLRKAAGHVNAADPVASACEVVEDLQS